MKKTALLGLSLLIALIGQAQESATLYLDAKTLMHEMRETPSPLPESEISDRFVSFQWPLPDRYNPRGSGLDGLAEREPLPDRSTLRYLIRYGQEEDLLGQPAIETRHPFLNVTTELKAGRWYWQYGYVNGDSVRWSPTMRFYVRKADWRFAPPAFEELIASLGEHHPRVILDGERWEEIISRSHNTPERKAYLRTAEEVLQKPMQTVDDIAVERIANLENEMQRNAMLTRESRRIIDREEANCNTLIRAWLLTRDRRYADEALNRVRTIASWEGHPNIKGDFNNATMLSLCSELYDALYEELDEETREELRDIIRRMGNKMYHHFSNRLENHIADNHVWQMTLRILTMAAFTTYGEIEEAAQWADYCYNLWLARLPGLNRDGAWHNGDSYFHVNIRTLVEVPWLYSRLSGYDFFSDPWYQGNVLYVIYQQPPFSKSGGNGSSHQKILKPNGPRVSYAEALARMCQNSYAADYVRLIQAQEPNILMRNAMGKSGGLAWWRLQCDREMPSEGEGLADLPFGKVFPESGLASFSTALEDTPSSVMLSFRSSPYGSTSHAISNQNAFNTFYGGYPLFYSSGHHVAFVDRHALLCHRASRGHNTILPEGLNQRIGTEGYGWTPRHYVGEELGYVVGDASNAYGEVISPLWLERARAAEVEFSPENGWDKSSLKRFRRHVVMLGKSGWAVIYDELEAEEPIEWHYLLHAIKQPLEFSALEENLLHIRARNHGGQSDAYLYGSGVLRGDTTSQFFVEPESWLRIDEKGNRESYPNHFHFTARSEKSARYRFATFVHTHAKGEPTARPEAISEGGVRIGEWQIQINLSPEGEPLLKVERQVRRQQKVSLKLQGDGPTYIVEGKNRVTLVDTLPQLEI
uniref:DUF4962 domain-containing protein n=1 Tax=Alistipes sp. TaxID=1872444 RepID=UPI0040578AE3